MQVTQDPVIQDRVPNNHCFGCGPLNPKGLKLKSLWSEGEATAEFLPWPEHMAGPTHILNGGIIATLCDCHAVCTAIADAYVREGREIGEPPDVWCATGTLSVRYLRPTPLARPVKLRAVVTDRTAKKTVLTCTLASDGEVTASADVVAIRVPESWRHGRPG